MSVWQQTAVLVAAEAGHFDKVPVEKVNDAKTALLTALGKDHKDVMNELNKGDKADEKMTKLIEKAAEKAVKGFTN
jgi:F0F1-type ATP synthase alpha subunit